MATVTLVSKAGVEFTVTTVRGFVNQVYGRGAMPKTGTVSANFEYLLTHETPPFEGANEAVTLHDLQTPGTPARTAVEGVAFAASGGGFVHTQGSPSASWSIANPLGRVPSVDLYVGGQQVEADVSADATAVSVVFPTPTAGIAVLV